MMSTQKAMNQEEILAAGERLITVIQNVMQPKQANPLALNAEQLAAVGRLAAKHDVVHFIGLAAAGGALKLPTEKQELYQTKMLRTAMQMEQLQFAYFGICQTLQQAGVAFLPLKGAVLKSIYPQSWMRTCCDIDILVKKEEIEPALQALQQQNGYAVELKNYHDYSLVKKGAPHLELHFSLKETHSNIDALLEKAWQFAGPKAPGSFEYQMTPDFFAFHQYAHAYYHFLNGGCGIRTVLDLFLLSRAFPKGCSNAKPLLQQTGILKFAAGLNALGEAWFGGAKKTKELMLLQAYIFCGGVYGEQANRIALQQQRRGGKLRYAAGRIWPSPEFLQNQYPALQKHPGLYPVLQVHRWGRLLFGGGVRRSVRELSVNNQISETQADRARQLMKMLGLEKRP